jgi:aerobic carbon-monoxide dehydrogenase small subunit
MRVDLTLNGKSCRYDLEPRETLADSLRERSGLIGLHLGCEHGACGACTVLLDGAPVRSCLVLTAMCERRMVQTLEGLRDDKVMLALKRAFHECHALQCGFCTPGMLVAAWDIIHRHRVLDAATVRHALAGQICRCTGYVGIVNAILQAHAASAAEIHPAASAADTDGVPA